MGRKHPRRDEDAASPTHEPSALPWGMEKTEMQPSSLTALTDDKLARFVLGHQKKTKFQKEREDREAKKRQADAEAAQIYATFVASFDNEEDTRGKAFVRGETTQGKQVLSGDRHGGELYRLKGKDAAEAAQPGKKVSEMDKMLQEIKQKEAGRARIMEQEAVAQRPKKRRAIDEFLEEMKERGPAPVSMEVMGLAKGSFDNGDPETTNLYVGNLAPTVTEELLQAEFGRFGEVHSVKIMWPRSEEERARRRNCGFVSFYERRDADDARVNLNEKELEGQPMIVGWGKAVKIQPRARTSGVLLPSAVTPPAITAVPATPISGADMVGKPTITVQTPTDSSMRRRIDHLAQFVATDGIQFENAVRVRESDSKVAYAFLFDPQCAEAFYYRWRVYAFAMGDNEYSWREQPFQMTVDGPMWVPPKMPPRSHGIRTPDSASRSSGLYSHSDRGSPRQNRSRRRSYSRSRSRSPSSSPVHSRRRSRSGSRHRSRSRSDSSEREETRGRRRRRSRSRSRSRSHSNRSRSWSSDDSGPRKRSRRSRSRSWSRRNERRRDDRKRTRNIGRSSGFSSRGSQPLETDKKLLTGQQIARARDLERGRERSRLASEDYEDFKDLLGELTLERESIKRTMGFALDNSEAAVDLVNIILDSFKDPKASGVTLVGLLYVTSDILHNSSAAVKNASLFRTTFQECLPEIMDMLRVAHKSVAGRMSANAMKEKIMNVLNAWESWSLFPPAVLVGLHATFLRKVEEDEFIASRIQTLGGIGETDLERLRKTCRQSGIMSTGDAEQLVARLQWLKEFTSPSAPLAPGQSVVAKKPSLPTGITAAVAASRPHSTLNGITVAKSRSANEKTNENDLDGQPIDEDYIDGEPIADHSIAETGKEDIDGEPLDEDALDGVPLDAGADVDGEPLDEEDLDGAPLDDDDLDGEPI